MATAAAPAGKPGKVDLRSFQQELAERLARRSVAPAAVSRLALASGEARWLARLSDTGEVLGVPEITRVPLTREWYLGVANVRGNLYGIVDFSAFLGWPAARVSLQSRVVLLGARFADLRAGLLVERVHGLRELSDFEAVDHPATAPAWLIQQWRDSDGSDWEEVDFGRIARDPAFLQVGV